MHQFKRKAWIALVVSCAMGVAASGTEATATAFGLAKSPIASVIRAGAVAAASSAHAVKYQLPIASAVPSSTPAPFVQSKPVPTSASHIAAPRSVVAGAGLLGGWGLVESGWPQNGTELSSIENMVHHKVNYIQSYVHWGGGWGAFNNSLPFLQASLAHGATPVITWLSSDPTVTDQSMYDPRRISQGAFDVYARGWADGLRSLGQSVLMRFDPEMNGNWTSYSPGISGLTSADYVQAWRHLHDIFTAEGATNVKWVWSPNVEYNSSTPLPGLYPGDAYVDWLALDGYNWGSTNGRVWQSFASVFNQSLSDIEALSRRPVMLAEVGSSEVGGNKAAWITDMFFQLAHRPDIHAFIWFDLDKETDWRINSSTTAASAFTTGLSSLLP